ncbi:hypothetical protein IFU40_06005 [Microbacterium sp. CFBP 13617]|uniref:hypothetical protein n=1 Tax=Microbacterium sp. CFBP 13617 TaxID=2774035 RepID=UPI00177C2431|nr:hypothetical protein [Microbacterium sp. CFBP 13617]MBD8218185.1 hypothetical protein [Microbacterium sp. CFBP 13617]
MSTVTCPFCLRPMGGKDRSSEHIIPRWVHKLPGIVASYRLPANSGRSWMVWDHTFVRSQQGDSVAHLPAMRPAIRKPLHAHNLTIPVCRACNNGWMSQLEDSARPHLIPLIEGQTDELTAAASTDVMRWAAKTAVAFQQTDPPGATMLSAQLRDLVHGRLPRWVSVAIARCDDPGEAIMIHAPMAVKLSNPVGESDTIVGGRTIISVGEVALFVRQYDRPREFLEDQFAVYPEPDPPPPWRRVMAGQATTLCPNPISYDTSIAMVRPKPNGPPVFW